MHATWTEKDLWLDKVQLSFKLLTTAVSKLLGPFAPSPGMVIICRLDVVQATNPPKFDFYCLSLWWYVCIVQWQWCDNTVENCSIFSLVWLWQLPSARATHTHTQQFNGLWSGTAWVCRYQKKHSPTHNHPDHQTSFINFLHLPRSISSSLFSLSAWQSFSTTSLQVLFGLPLGLGPFTSYSIHFFTQSLSSFRSTCPYHRSLFCHNTSAMSLPNLSLSSLLGNLSFSLMPHIHPPDHSHLSKGKRSIILLCQNPPTLFISGGARCNFFISLLCLNIHG